MKKAAIRIIKIHLRSLILATYLVGGNVLAQTLKVPNNLIQFNSQEGEKLFIESNAREAFFTLSTQFVTQKNQAYCGVASSVMVLNGLQIPAPEAPEYSPFHVFTQENFFNNEATRKIITPDVVSRQGMTLDQLGQLLAIYNVQVKVYHAGDTSIEDFRKFVLEKLKQPNNFVIVNYLRKEIGQEKGGHISPIAAYNQKNDRVLIMDVSRYKYPPVWVKTTDLWRAMATVDPASNKTRGFVSVSRNP
ncbi:phytochelatin synthase family protein [Aetokthonos hydrillicola Thurmond2011]|jgi:hypothetical protein|uniref:glutathione gamma-glutamylcysteinyltransferase n=1 Tax=Aetokthonos hydrillicola Thurmond2011 TaxID=2712845 RepID=A0AAP5ICG3_9CYAN|nr:phytochelatin synthase family protein [Aetokthonos hydrillicola]MBO3463208.1 glutathione gamma-glutamylcysteinyltransferase [Aetokthonos hydrillicola CCALA 1050]MBW4583928.1 phytochelatin synthase family protein [Aetokthonos hydrillicola CCALA 1050]MDR9898876.1 phytochelatin synthase family protein [Aetokthonos hydrillicola Thurmond2011]